MDLFFLLKLSLDIFDIIPDTVMCRVSVIPQLLYHDYTVFWGGQEIHKMTVIVYFPVFLTHDSLE